jgi:hypothetical protein
VKKEGKGGNNCLLLLLMQWRQRNIARQWRISSLAVRGGTFSRRPLRFSTRQFTASLQFVKNRKKARRRRGIRRCCLS